MRPEHGHLAIVDRLHVRSRRRREHGECRGEVAGLLAPNSRNRAMNGASLSVKRCFVFGDFVPVNSKNADAGMRHRLLLAKLRPSDRKLKIGSPAARRSGRKVETHGGELYFLARRPHHPGRDR